MKKSIAACLAAAMILVGCGGGGGADQEEVADIIIEAAEAAGASPDADCIRDAAKKFSDEDAAAMVDAGPTGDPELSDEANEILFEMLSC